MRHIFLTFLLFTASLFTLLAEEITFQGNAPRQVMVGDKFQLTYSVNAEASDIRLADTPDFQILMGPSTSQSSSYQIIGSTMKSSVQFGFTYILKATKEGSFAIPPATVTVKGNKIQSNTLVVEVVKGNPNNTGSNGAGTPEAIEAGGTISDQDIIIKTVASKTSVYQGEAFSTTTKIYTKVGLDGITDVKTPDNRDFLSQEINAQGQPDWGYETLNGVNYRVGTFDQKLLIPQKSGKLTVSPTELEFLIRQKVQRQSNNVFGDYFNGSYRTIKKRVKSNSVSINVKPLPAGQPIVFSGITGDFTIDATISKTQAKANDGLTLKITLSGTGNHKLAETPKVKFPADFDTYEPKVTTTISNTASGMKGSKVFEYLVIPRHEGTFTIPSVEFSYFNPQTEQYKTVSTKPIDLNIQKGDAGSTSNNNNYIPVSTKEEVKLLGQDIRFIKQTTSTLKPAGNFFWGSALFITLYLLAILLTAGALWLYRKQAHDNANVHLVNKSKANKIAIKRLKTAAHFLQTKEKEKFYDEVLRALWGYLGHKLNLPLSELSKDNASSILLAHGSNNEQVATFMSILDTCEYARYAPGSGSEEMDKLYSTALETISQLESKIK